MVIPQAGRPQDAVYAVADGIVTYVNAMAGNSNYGKYVVLTHACPSGMVYTLYAHLAAFSPGVGRGQAIKAGDVLGIVGHTANPPIPLDRAHLHFEAGLILNARFSQWCRAQKLKNDIQSVLVFTPKIEVLPPNTIPETGLKAKRVIDERKKV